MAKYFMQPIGFVKGGARVTDVPYKHTYIHIHIGKSRLAIRVFSFIRVVQKTRKH